MIKNLDLFGSLHKARILNEDPFYKSTYGGIWSILIYGFCLFYFIYGMVQWRFGYFLPKVTTIESLSQDMEFDINYEILSLKLRRANGSVSEVDPFQKENNIITPQLTILENNIVKSSEAIYSDENGYISVSNIKLMQNSTYELQAVLGLTKCLQNCASNEEIEAFFNQPSNMIEMNINLMQYNVNDKNYEIIPRTLKFALTNDQTFYGQLILKLMDSSTNSGVITDEVNTKQILNNFELIGQSLNLNYLQNAAHLDIYTKFLIQLSTTKLQQTIAFPKFGEILAAIGSIIQTIMLLKYVPLYTNEKLAYKEIIDAIIGYYYPEFQDYQITHTTLGILKVRRKGEIVNKAEFQQVYNKIADVAKQKLTLANIVYEISRISFLLKEKFSAEDIQKTHELGIPWPKSLELDQELESLNRQYSEFSLFMKQPHLEIKQKIQPKS